MKQLNEFEKQMLLYRIDNLKNLSNKDFMVSFAGIVNDFNLLQKEDFDNLQDHDWCRDNIRHEYTIIKPLSKDVSNALVEEKKDNTGRQRYYDNVFYIKGKNVLLSSEWYDGTGRKPDNKTLFVNWLRDLVNDHTKGNVLVPNVETQQNNVYRSYITAIKSKPFLLLAGISGTGKSRIVRELARACWDEGSEEYKAQKPKNFEMVQVKPNWHDSSELIGYVSRVSGQPVFVAGDFLKFVAKAWENPEMPYFLCLDEMNLAPVEQYFAEYLSVVESRKCQEDGTVTTDPILKPEYEKERDEKTGNLVPKKWYSTLVSELLAECPPETMFALKTQFENDGICIPQNLIVVGTVNMDETTFSFSRKVLDRAMTIEMNEVDLYGGLDSQYEKIGKLEAGNLIGTAVEGVDVYQANATVCDTALKYLETVNTELEGTPFKVAYRTRNEFLLYVVNNLPYNKDRDGNELDENFVIARALDEITSMKILSRIEGDETKIGKLLDKLSATIGEQLKVVSEKEYSAKKDDGEKVYSVSLAKLEEMKKRLESGYTSFWS